MIKFYRTCSKDELRNLIGPVLIFIGIGCKNSIGSMLIYILSYFKANYSEQISLERNGMFVNVYSVPAAISALWSIRVYSQFNPATYFQTLCILDTCSYCIATLLPNNFYLFLLFYSWIPNYIAYAFMLPPLLKFVWSTFANHKGFVTGVLFASSGFSQLFYIFFSSQIINPQDVKANIIVKENKNYVRYFDNRVNSNFHNLIIFQAISFGIFVITGSFIMKTTKKSNYLDENNQEDQNQINQENNKEQNQNNALEQNQKCEEKILSQLSLNQQSEQQLDNKLNQQNEVNQCQSLKQALLSETFSIYFIITLFLYCFDCLNNYIAKEIFLKSLKDDRLITIILTLGSLSNSTGKLFFGYLYDQVNFKRLFQGLIMMFLVSTMVFTIFMKISDVVMVVSYLVIQVVMGGMNSVECLGLNNLFGQKMSSELYPYKGLSFHLATFSVGLSLNTLLAHFTYQHVYLLFSIFSFLSIILSSILNYSPTWNTHQPTLFSLSKPFKSNKPQLS